MKNYLFHLYKLKILSNIKLFVTLKASSKIVNIISDNSAKK